MSGVPDMQEMLGEQLLEGLFEANPSGVSPDGCGGPTKLNGLRGLDLWALPGWPCSFPSEGKAWLSHGAL